MRYRYLLLFAFLLNFLLVSCLSECPPDEEPVMKTVVRLYDSTNLNPSLGTMPFKRIYGLGAHGNVAMNDSISYLPLSLHADSVTYIFEGMDGDVDTLILFYTRNFGIYKASPKRCGYGADFNGDYFIQGSNDTLHVINNPRYYHTSRTTFSDGYAQYRENAGIFSPTENLYSIELYQNQ